MPAFLSRAQQPAERLAVGPDAWVLEVSGQDTAGQLSVMRWEGRAPGGPPLHVHADQDEVFFVEAGQYRFQCGEEQFSLQAGDAIFLPRGLPHSFCQDSAEGALRYAYTPAGRMEDFFRALATLSGPPEPAAAAALFAAHGMEIVGPPI